MQNSAPYNKNKRTFSMLTDARYVGAKSLATDPSYSTLGSGIVSKFVNEKAIGELSFSFGNVVIPVKIGPAAEVVTKQTKIFPQVFGKTKTKNYDFSIHLEDTAGSSAGAKTVTSQWAIKGSTFGVLQELSGWTNPPQFCRIVTKKDLFELAIRQSPRLLKSMQWYCLHGREITNAKIQLTVYADSKSSGVVIDYDESLFTNITMDKKDIPMKDRMVAVECASFDSMFPTAKLLEDAGNRIKREFHQSVVTDRTVIDGFVEAAGKRLKDAKKDLGQFGVDADNAIHNVKIGYVPLLAKIGFVSDKPTVQVTMSVKFWYKNSVFEPYLQYVNSTIIPKMLVGGVKMLDASDKFQKGEHIDHQLKQEIVLKASAKKLTQLNFAVENKVSLAMILDHPYMLLHYALADWEAIIVDQDLIARYAKFRKYNKGLLRSFQAMFNTDPNYFKQQMSLFTQDDAPEKWAKKPLVVKVALENLARAYNDKFQGGASDEVTRAVIFSINEWLVARKHAGVDLSGIRSVRGQGGNYAPKAFDQAAFDRLQSSVSLKMGGLRTRGPQDYQAQRDAYAIQAAKTYELEKAKDLLDLKNNAPMAQPTPSYLM